MTKKRIVMITIAAAIVFASAAAMVWITTSSHKNTKPVDLSSFTLQAQSQDNYGIMLDTDFTIDCDPSFSRSDLEQLLTVTPSFSYKLSKQEAGKYLLLPQEPLEADTLYQLELGNPALQQPRSWAFQTRRGVGIRNTLPMDGAKYVPITTGIELALSHADLNVKEHFEIEPAIPGSWRQTGSTLVFMPHQPLAFDTLYTVTIRAGVQGSGDEAMTEDYRFSFRTDSDYNNSTTNLSFAGSRYSETFTTKDTPVIEVYLSGEYPTTAAAVEVYRLRDEQQYLSLLEQRHTYVEKSLGDPQNFIADTQALTLLTQFETLLENTDPNNYWGTRMTALPEPLAKGYYLFSLVLDEPGSPTIQKLVQVTDTSLYRQNSSGQSLFWVNDGGSGQAIAGAEIQVSTSADFSQPVSSITDETGVAFLDLPDSGINYYRVVKDGQVLFLDTLDVWRYSPQEWNRPFSESYWSMLYTDRTVYLPNDSIRFWGKLHPRMADAKLPESISARLYLGTEADTKLEETTLKVDRDGIFSGELSFAKLQSSYYNLYITDSENNAYTYTGLRIADYIKPEYVITAAPDKPYYAPGEPVNINVEAAFYDGTPSENMDFQLETGIRPTSFSTNSQGKGLASYILPDTAESFAPYSSYFSLSSIGPENETSYTYGNLLVIPRNVTLRTQLTAGAKGYDLQIFTNQVDYSKIDPALHPWSYSAETLLGSSVALPVKVQIYQVDVLRQQEGEYYDFINKITLPRYRYSTSERLVEERSLQTAQGQALLSQLNYQSSNERYYYARVSCVDLNNRPLHTDVHLGARFSLNNYGSSLKQYTLARTADFTQKYPTRMAYLASGQELELSLYENDLPVENKGQILYITGERRVLAHAVTGERSLSLTFEENHLPNVKITAAYFDGRHIYALPQYSVYLDTQSRALNLSISTDKEQYAPGEEVSAQVTLTQKDGNPAEGHFALSVVDEAVFAVNPQNYNAAEDLYESIYYPYTDTFASYVQYDSGKGSMLDNDPGMGGGDGDGGEMRKKFYDTAFFYTGKTDRSGQAAITFKLPDNLTSWRITAAAVTDHLYAGDAVTNITASAPFFIQPLVSRRYLAEDDLAFTARIRSSKTGNAVWTATLLQDGTSLASLDGNGQTCSFNFGKLPVGEYQLRLSARQDNASDALELPVAVVKSGMERPVFRQLNLGEPLNLTPQRYPVTLSFYDAKHQTYSRVLDTLLSARGRRIDQRLAYAFALNSLQQNGQELPYYLQEDIDLSDLRDSSNISLFPYGEPDPVLSGKVVAVGSSYLPVDTRYYLQNVVNNSEASLRDLAGAYLGLAALKEPVLIDLRLLMQNPDLTQQEQLLLIAALGFIGDQSAALSAYEQSVSAALTRENHWAYLKAEDENRSATFDLTASALLAATAARSPDAALLAEYLCANPSAVSLANLELMAYAQAYAPRQDSQAEFSYLDANGKTQTIKLAEAPHTTLFFNKQGLAEADFKVLKGEVGATALYIGSGDEVSHQPIDGVRVNKYIINTQGGNTFTPGDLVAVHIKVEVDRYAPSGYYAISDYIPSGMRYVGLIENRYNANPFWQLQSREGQNLYLGLFHSLDPENLYLPEDGEDLGQTVTETGRQRTYHLGYYARCVLPGEYAVDSAIITQTETGSTLESTPFTIAISE